MVSKSLGLDEVSSVASNMRTSGKTVVLCHGMFDLVHLGHVRHLQRAKKEGDILVVTITADKYANKAPGRPIFTQDQRVENLAALECVDYVSIVNDKTALPSIEAVKPDFYVKGSDYADDKGDVSGKIVDERNAVERSGGTLIFTDELTFSSSNLLNEHFSLFPTETKKYLSELKQKNSGDDIIRTLSKLEGMNVLVVGEAIIDRYTYTQPLGTTGKGNFLAVRYKYQEDYAGGSIAVANHVAPFVQNVTLLSGIGGAKHGDRDFSRFIRENLKKNVTSNLVKFEKAKTVMKERFVDNDLQKLFEIYHFEEEPQHTKEEEEEIDQWLRENIAQFDAVIVPDYGNGFITKRMRNILCEHAKFLAVNTQINSGNRGYHVINRYPRADFISLNEPELRLAMHDKHSSVNELADGIAKKLGVQYVSVTRGSAGLLTLDQNTDDEFNVPALASKVVDRVGAGDAYLSLASICLANGIEPRISAFIGAIAAALDVQIVGNRETIDPVFLKKYLTVLLK